MVMGLFSLVVGAVVLFGLLATVRFAGCAPVLSPLDIVPNALPVAIMAGAAYALAYVLAADRVRDGHPVLGVFNGVVAWLVMATLTLFVFSVFAFPALSCAAPQ